MKSQESNCPIAKAAAIVGDLWTILILRELAEGTKRFKDLSVSIEGINTRTLTQRLRKLESEQMVLKESFKEAPPRIEYSLTEKGRAVLPMLDHMKAFGTNFAS